MRAGAHVRVYLKAIGTGRTLECPATTEAATNKIFHAAVFELPEPGWWDVDVAVEGPHGAAHLRFRIDADGPVPPWLELWPWFTWPALVVALFGLHRVLVRQRIPLPSPRSHLRGKNANWANASFRSFDKQDADRFLFACECEAGLLVEMLED